MARFFLLLGTSLFWVGCNTEEGSVAVDVGSAPLAAAYRVDVYAQEGGLGLVEGQYVVDQQETTFHDVPVGRWSVFIQAQNGDQTTIAHYIGQFEVKANEVTYVKAEAYRPGLPGDALPESDDRLESFGPDGQALLSALYAPGVESVPAAVVSLLAESGQGSAELPADDEISAQRAGEAGSPRCGTTMLAGQEAMMRKPLEQAQAGPAYGSVAPGESVTFQVATTGRTAECVRVLEDSQTEHCLIFSEVIEGVPLLGQARALEIAAGFDRDNPFQEGDRGVYLDTQARFGTEWNANPVGGRDGERRVVLVFLGSSSIGGQGLFGFFSPADQSSRQSSPNSNEGEILYVNADRANEDLYHALDTLSHELVHLILYNQKVGLNGEFPEGALPENATLDEGLAVLNEELSGFGFEGPEGGNGFLLGAVEAVLKDGLNRPFFSFGRGYSDYGAGYLFWRYLLDQHGADTLRAITTSSARGKENIGAVLNESFATIFLSFAQAVALNGESGTPQELTFDQLDLQGTYTDRDGKVYALTGLSGVIEQSFPAQVTREVDLQPWGVAFTRAAGGDGSPLLWRATGIESLLTRIVDLSGGVR